MRKQKQRRRRKIDTSEKTCSVEMSEHFNNEVVTLSYNEKMGKKKNPKMIFGFRKSRLLLLFFFYFRCRLAEHEEKKKKGRESGEEWSWEMKTTLFWKGVLIRTAKKTDCTVSNF